MSVMTLIATNTVLLACVLASSYNFSSFRCQYKRRRLMLASYPGLLAPAYVACSTNAGEGLVKLSHVVGRTWTCGRLAHSRKTASKRVCYQLQTRTVERLSVRHQTVLATFLGFRKLLYSCTKGMCHSSTRPGTSYHMTQFYQA